MIADGLTKSLSAQKWPAFLKQLKICEIIDRDLQKIMPKKVNIKVLKDSLERGYSDEWTVTELKSIKI